MSTLAYGNGFYSPRPQAVHYGRDVVRDSLFPQIRELGRSRAVILTGPTIAHQSGLLDRIVPALGSSHGATIILEGEHSDLTYILEVAQKARDLKADCIVTVGGGGPVDLGKGVYAVLKWNLFSLEEFEAQFEGQELETKPASSIKRPPSPLLTHLCIPTTLVGAAHTSGAGFLSPNRGSKRIYSHPEIAPGAVFLDPEMTIPTPMQLWASSGIKALDHAIEKFCCLPVHPIIDPLALSAAATILSSLPDSVEGNSESGVSQRLSLLVASWQAMLGGVGIFKSGLSHALGRQLGALCNVPHGLTSCVTLPVVMEFNRAQAEEPLARLGEAFGSLNGSPKTRAQAAIDAVKRLIQCLGLPTRLRDVGVRKELLAAVAAESLKDQATRINPRPVRDSALIMELLESIW